MLAFGAGLIKSISDGLTEHETILDALLRRDPDAAEAAMRAHVRRSVVWLHHEADLLEGVGAAAAQPIETQRARSTDTVSRVDTSLGRLKRSTQREA